MSLPGKSVRPTTSIKRLRLMHPHRSQHQVSNCQRSPAPLRALCMIAIALATAASGFAQTTTQWSTVDDFREAWEWAMAADRSGNVFVAGDFGYINRTTDQGATWT